VLLILDEVMCGMGRTGHLFACEAEQVNPDILCIAKGLGAGYQPIGAMLCSKAIYSAIESGSGFFQHGHTYLGHPVAAAAGQAVLEQLTTEGLMDQVQSSGAYLQRTLGEVFNNHPAVGDIRGRGLFVGVELVADRSLKQPFDPSLGIAGRLKKAAFERGLICYPMPGTRDGKHGDHVLLAPPFIATHQELDFAVEVLAEAVNEVTA
ncbi:MAG: aminotransferase class III-fold pyridoxal phosphate-dependent enzyme, partial [Pseudomonadota bacterium]